MREQCARRRPACTNLAACRCRDVVNCSRMQGDSDEEALICCLGRLGFVNLLGPALGKICPNGEGKDFAAFALLPASSALMPRA